MSPFQQLPNRTPDKLHVALIVGTRPEAIKLAPVAVALQARPEAKVSIWCTGQHPLWAVEMLAYFGLTADRLFDLSQQPPGLAQLCSAMLAHLRTALETERPDVVVVQGDTSSAFAGALAAAYRQIPLVHVEAGLRSNNRHIPFPEEAHRRAIANFTSLHCAPTQTAVDALLSEGVAAADILQCGNTVIDALQWIQRSMAANDRVAESGKLVLLTCHRRESWGEPFRAVCAAARHLANRGDCEIVFVVHPNQELVQVAHEMLGGHPGIRLVAPLGYPQFMYLLQRATLVLTDSGGIQEEAAALGTPLLVLRETTERPEGVGIGIARLVGTTEQAIVTAASALLDHPAELAAMRVPCTLYGDGNAGVRIALAILYRWMIGGHANAEAVAGSSRAPHGETPEIQRATTQVPEMTQ
jgi:UDP-N-acetylglucosamine 2-epimerase (non-hydrolysing)